MNKIAQIQYLPYLRYKNKETTSMHPTHQQAFQWYPKHNEGPMVWEI